MVLFVGVDGGGTGTRACVFDAEDRSQPHLGTVKGIGESGGSNKNSVGEETAGNNVRQAIIRALDEAGAQASDVQGVCLTLSGCDRKEDVDIACGWVKELLPSAKRFEAYNDAVGALATGTGGVLEGVVVITGTGTIAFGRTSDGETTRASGWGPLLGDRGSGFDLGMQVLSTATRLADGRLDREESCLLDDALSHLNLKEPDDLIGWAYADTVWSRFAALARIGLDAAAKGDKLAVKIVDEAAAEVAHSIATVAKKLKLTGTEFNLVTVGGLFKARLWEESVLAHLRRVEKRFLHLPPKVEPCVGAALVAAKEK